jgi:hypothetical protein
MGGAKRHPLDQWVRQPPIKRPPGGHSTSHAISAIMIRFMRRMIAAEIDPPNEGDFLKTI